MVPQLEPSGSIFASVEYGQHPYIVPAHPPVLHSPLGGTGVTLSGQHHPSLETQDLSLQGRS